MPKRMRVLANVHDPARHDMTPWCDNKGSVACCRVESCLYICVHECKAK